MIKNRVVSALLDVLKVHRQQQEDKTSSRYGPDGCARNSVFTLSGAIGVFSTPSAYHHASFCLCRHGLPSTSRRQCLCPRFSVRRFSRDPIVVEVPFPHYVALGLRPFVQRCGPGGLWALWALLTLRTCLAFAALDAPTFNWCLVQSWVCCSSKLG